VPEQGSRIAAIGVLEENRAGQLTRDQVRAVRRITVRRWARAIVGRLSFIAAAYAFLWASLSASPLPNPPSTPFFVGIGLLGVLLVGGASRRLLNLWRLARAPVLTVEGPIILLAESTWFIDGEVFTAISPWDHWMQVVRSLRGTLDPTAYYRLFYLKLRYTPDLYFIVGAERLRLASEEEIQALDRRRVDITPEWDWGE
jgi:hypothetical protein